MYRYVFIVIMGNIVKYLLLISVLKICRYEFFYLWDRWGYEEKEIFLIEIFDYVFVWYM